MVRDLVPATVFVCCAGAAGSARPCLWGCFSTCLSVPTIPALDTINQAVNVLFRIDPLARPGNHAGSPYRDRPDGAGLLVVFLSLVAGRTFCGWLCPLGTLLDASRPLVTARRTDNRTLWPWLGTTSSGLSGGCGIGAGAAGRLCRSVFHSRTWPGGGDLSIFRMRQRIPFSPLPTSMDRILLMR